VAIGHKPNTDIFKDFITLDETGYIYARKFKTNVEGVFVSEMLQTTYTVKRLPLLERVVWLLLMLKDIYC
jgi:alkyl hydroperoxide reductase subunit AhpF